MFSVSIELNPHSQCVKLTQLASNHSAVNGEALALSQERQLKNGDIIEVLHNSNYKYQVELEGINSFVSVNSNKQEQNDGK